MSVAPLLASIGVTATVNQGLPILLSWSPKGFARSYQLQISANADFSTNLVSIGYQTDAFYVWNGAAPGATYYYRVQTVNAGGASDWSAGSFSAVAASLNVMFPNGGEALQRGLKYFIRWNDNLAESVNLELYQGATLGGDDRHQCSEQWRVLVAAGFQPGGRKYLHP